MMLLIISINGQAKEKLIWVTDDKMELENYFNDVETSIGTDTTKLVVKSLLKFYDIDIQLAQLPRTDRLLTSLPNLCTSNRIKTKARQKENLFSSPVNLFLSTRLYFLYETRFNQGVDLFQSLINENGELISLQLLFDTFPELVLGLSKGRSFGSALDKQLSNIAQENLIYRGGRGRYKALVNMLLKKRIEFILKFPTEAKRELDINVEKYQVSSLAIVGNDQFILGHIACSQSELGQRVIKQSNEILHKLYRQPVFYQAHSRYLSTMDLINFNRFYQQVYQVKPPVSLKANNNVNY